MGQLVRQWIPFTIAIIVALVVLLSPKTLTFNYRGQRTPLQHILIDWAIIVASFTLVLGLWNISRIHLKKAFRRRNFDSLSSILLILCALGTFAIAIASSPLPFFKSISEPANDLLQFIFDYIISPVGASLAALVAFTLAVAVFRLLRAKRSNWETFLGAIFVVTVSIVLLTAIPLALIDTTGFSLIRHVFVDVVGMAGMRGLLLGIVLGTAITALRFLWPRSES
jgi:hypothetical protein